MAHLRPRLGPDQLMMIRQLSEWREQDNLEAALATQNRFLNTLLVWKRDGYLDGGRLAVIFGHLVRKLLPNALGEIEDCSYWVNVLGSRVTLTVVPNVEAGDGDAFDDWLWDLHDQIRRIPLSTTILRTVNDRDMMAALVTIHVDIIMQDPHEYIVTLDTDHGRAMADRLFRELRPVLPV